MAMDTAQIQGYIDTAVTMIVEYTPRLVGVFVVVVVGRWLARRLGVLAGKGLRKAKIDETLAEFGSNAIRYFVLLITGLACLELFGIKTTSFVAVLAAAGFAVGLALQGSLGNFASGVLLLIFRPFSVGDVISAGGATGEVKSLGMFATTLQTPDFIVITVSNSAVTSGNINNYTAFPQRRVDVNVGVAYSAEPDKAKEVLLTMLKAIPEVDETAANAVVLTGLGASSVDFQMRAWGSPADYWTIREKLSRGAWYALRDAGIGIPYQTIDVHIVSEPAKG
jgi:small conductance mechanosensitive channel